MTGLLVADLDDHVLLARLVALVSSRALSLTSVDEARLKEHHWRTAPLEGTISPAPATEASST